MPVKAKELVAEAKNAIESHDAELAQTKIKESVATHGAERTEQELRRGACFRSSSYDYETKTLKAVVLAVRSSFSDPIQQEYFDSVLTLIWLAETARGMVREAQRHCDRDDVKTFLVALDFLFLRHVPRAPDEMGLFEGHSKEGLCSAFAYLYFLMTRTKTLKSSDLNRINYTAIKNVAVYDTLAAVASVLQLRNAELLVDAYDFVATRNGRNCFVRARNPDFEKSVRLGHILLETQQFVVAMEEPESSEAMSIIDAAEVFAEKFEGHLVEVVEKPFRRLRVKLPLVDQFKKMFGTGAAFAEDLTLRRAIQKELLLDPELYRRPVIDGVSALDLSTLQRLFLFITSILYSYCKKRGILFQELHAASQLKLFKKEDLLQLLTEVFDAERAEAMIKLLSWSPTPSDYFDLQYQPFIPAEDFLATPTAICGLSSLTRNLLVKHKIRYDSESEADPVGDRLGPAAKEQFSSVHRNISYEWTENGEIDVFIVGKECVFAFECKNTIHPSSPFELRGAYQQLNDSVEQLNRLKRFYPDPKFREYLQKRLKLSDPLPTVLHVCTVTGVRTFAGLRWQGVPTRPLWELCNFLSSGVVTLNAASDGKVESVEFRLWKNEKFAETDLVEALSTDSFWELRLTAMEEVVHSYALRGKNLKFVTYAKNLATLVKLMENKYTVVEKAVEMPSGGGSSAYKATEEPKPQESKE